MVFVVTQKSGFGLSECFNKYEVTINHYMNPERFIVKYTEMTVYSEHPSLISYYVDDHNHVNFFSVYYNRFVWVDNHKFLRRNIIGKLVIIRFIKLGINNEYNKSMMNIFIYDQLNRQ